MKEIRISEEVIQKIALNSTKPENLLLVYIATLYEKNYDPERYDGRGLKELVKDELLKKLTKEQIKRAVKRLKELEILEG